ncbi:hypothetical protein B7Z17_04060, partial [Candidatus Saccharibacteria bacterium 32-49-10]
PKIGIEAFIGKIRDSVGEGLVILDIASPNDPHQAPVMAARSAAVAVGSIAMVWSQLAAALQYHGISGAGGANLTSLFGRRGILALRFGGFILVVIALFS